MGFAVDNAITGKRFDGEGHRRAFINSVSAMLVNSGEYVREENKELHGDYDILLNPNYFLNKSIVSTNNVTRFIAVIAVSISVLTLAKDIFKSTETHVPELQQTNTQLEKQEKALNKIEQRLENVQSSLDSLKKK